MVQTDGERESVPSLHSMPAGLAIHFPPLKGRHHIDVPWYGCRVVWPGCRGVFSTAGELAVFLRSAN